MRSAKVSNKEEAYLSRFHNDANVLTLSSKVPSMEALEIAQTFLSSNFSNEPRHKNRIEKISEIENKILTQLPRISFENICNICRRHCKGEVGVGAGQHTGKNKRQFSSSALHGFENARIYCQRKRRNT